ncbi:MAG: glycosyltransferase, partial [Chromatiaceae bacterium]|nr:glycosyltransferase [Chromatiaceae bacterium]
FQVGHGFSTETGTLVANPLPLPVGYPDRATELPPIQYSPVEAIDGLLGFLGTQAALWGLLALPLIVGVIRCCRRKPQGGQRVLDSPAKALLVAGSFFPLAFFSLIATFSEVEPNWPGMYLSTAAPLAALATERMRRWVMIGGGGNLLFVSLYVLHGATGILPLLDGQNRVLRESQGYSELAHRLAILPEPLFADRYQIVAMTRFYAPIRQTTQWPGISRPSEYLRGTVAATVTREEIEQAGGFWFLSKRFEPLTFPGFKLRSQSSIFHCRDRGLVEAPTDAALPCSHPLHRWQLFGYVTDATRPSTGARGD